LAHLAAQTDQLFTLGGREGLGLRLAAILGSIRLSNPVPDGLSRRLELTGDICGIASGADQFDDLTTELSGIGPTWVRHRRHLVGKPEGLHDSGSTSAGGDAGGVGRLAGRAGLVAQQAAD
jgi:hypothetical protein